MKKLNKLVALLLAAVMVLGMMPTMTVHAHARTAQTLGIEDYPALELGVEFVAVIEGTEQYVTFTPEMSTQYRFVALGDGDTVGTLYDDQNNQLASSDDCYMHNHASTRHFCINAVLEAGKTYVLKHNYYNSGTTGTYNLLVTHEHYYEGTVTVPSTCTEDGVMTYSCACGEGESYTEVIPAGHKYDEAGVCTDCGFVYLITGECGENLTWEMDWAGNLTIKGTGDMYHYLVSWGADKYPAPWYDYRNEVTSITVEDGCTSIGNYAFYYCQYATELTLPESVTALGSNSFNSCYGLTSVDLPEGITEIPDSCFYYCGSLAEVEWPDALTTIGSNAFNSCNLGDLVLPEGVTTLGQYAFGGNSLMTKLTLPSTLTEVADYAFSRMWNIKDIVFTGDAPTFGGSNVFQYVVANAWYPLGNETWTEEVCQQYGGTITWSGLCSGAHTWGEAVTVEATCETGSYMTMACTVCGYVAISPENDDALGHDYQYEHYDAGCGDYSYDITTCTRCDYYATENWVWTDHTYEQSHVDATCEVGGYDVYTCIHCGYYYEADWTTPLGHDVAEWSEPTEATCTEAGVKTGHCARCDLDVSEVVTPALGHEWDEENGTVNEDGSVTYACTRCDATYTTEGSYLYLGDNQFTIEGGANTSTKTYTATEAGTLTITLNNLYYHNTYAYDNGWVTDYWQTLAIDWAFSQGFFNVYVNGENSTYTVEGYETAANVILTAVEVAAGDVVTVEIVHTSSSWYNTDPVKFNVNLALEGAEPAPGANTLILGDNEFSMAANAGEGPVYSWTATEEGTLTIEMTSLSMYLYSFWNEEPVAPHLEDGNVTFKVNGEAVTTPSTTVAVKAGDVVTVQIGNFISFDMKAIVNLSFEAGAVHEHSFGEWTVTTAPTCTEAGVETRSCECGEIETREVAALGHTEEVIPAVEPTFDAPGLTEGKRCSVCGEILVAQEEIAMLDYNEGIVPINVLTATAGDWQTGYEATEGPAALVLDDDFSTIWHTNWYGTSRENHWIQFELSESYTVDGLRLKPRTTGGTNGIITQYAIQVSNDGENFTTVAEGNWEADRTWKTVEFDGQVVKYVRLVALDGVTDQAYVFASAAEIRLTGEKSDEPLPHEHSFGEWSVTAEPTCTEAGLETRSCECGETETREIPALGHDFVNGECTRCDATKDATFEDVAVGSFFFDPVEWAVEEGITTGATDTTFNPTGDLLRAQFVTFLWRAAGSPEPATTENPFTDVKDGDFFYKAVLWAVEEGITNGVSTTEFGAYKVTNRAQAVTFLWRYLDQPTSTASNDFTDVEAGAWYEAPINWAVENGVTNGMGDGTFGINNPCNRAHAVTFMYRALAK